VRSAEQNVILGQQPITSWRTASAGGSGRNLVLPIVAANLRMRVFPKPWRFSRRCIRAHGSKVADPL
jgi:hypothetical protein